MKLRISSCKTVLAKDLTRFAPAWGLYLIGLLMLMLPNLVYDDPHVVARTIGETIGPLGILNFIYAALCAQLLFGDLFQTRLCNALHAMPLKRSDWFWSHIVAGLSFSLVPNTICTLLMIPLLGEFWFISLFWMGAMTLEFLFFFGLAVLSMLCVGSRFAMVAVYAILNFLSILVLWFVKTVFEPLIFGLYLPVEPFFIASPVVQLARGQEYICFDRIAGVRVFTGLGAGWGYLLILAGVGLIFGFLALLLYRRRALETAGDFMAVRPLAPVFGVVYTLTATALFTAMGELFMGETIYFFPIGFLVGYFTSQMLLRRTVKVFTGKVFLWFGIFATVITACMTLIVLDPLGYTRWTPEPSQVTSVEISNEIDVVLAVNGLYPDDFSQWEDTLQLDDPGDIAAVVDLHREVTETRGDNPNGERVVSLRIVYTLQNGRKVTRVYENCVPAQPLAEFFSRLECVLGIAGDVETFLAGISTVNIEGKPIPEEPTQELLKAILADCEGRTMAQDTRYHDYNKEMVVTWVDFRLPDGTYRDLRIYSGAENTIAWLKENFALWGNENTKLEDYFQGK